MVFAYWAPLSPLLQTARVLMRMPTPCASAWPHFITSQRHRICHTKSKHTGTCSCNISYACSHGIQSAQTKFERYQKVYPPARVFMIVYSTSNNIPKVSYGE